MGNNDMQLAVDNSEKKYIMYASIPLLIFGKSDQEIPHKYIHKVSFKYADVFTELIRTSCEKGWLWKIENRGGIVKRSLLSLVEIS